MGTFRLRMEIEHMGLPANLLVKRAPSRKASQRYGKRFAESLGGTEDQFRLLFERNLAGVYRSSPDGRILHCNESLARIFGYASREELLARSACELYHTAADRQALVERLRTERSLTNFERCGRRKDGSPVWLLENVTLLEVENGRREVIEATVLDITERKRAETFLGGQNRVLEMIARGAQLPEVLAALTRLVENLSPGLLCSVLLLDRDGRRLRHGAAPSLPESYNRAVDGIAIGPSAGSCGTAAYRGEAVIVEDIAHDPLWVDFRELGLRHGLRACWSIPILATSGAVQGTFAMYYREPRRPNSADRELIERATHLAGIAIERQLGEEALRQAEEKYRSIVENAVEGVFQTTPEGRYVSVNPALARMYGYASPEELMSSVTNIGGQIYVDPARRLEFQRLMEVHDVVQKFEYEVYRKNGSTIWLSECARAVRDAAGAILYYEGTVEDITERKRAELERQVMVEIIHGVNLTANLDELLGLIHQSLQKVINAENCFVALHDQESGLFYFPFFVDQFDTPPPPQKLERSCTAYVFRTGQPQLITQEDFARLEAAGEVELVGTNSPAWLGVPLKTPVETIGVLVVQHYADTLAYCQRDLDFLASVGGQIALAIERKRAEDALRRSEANFRSLVLNAPYGIFRTDPDGSRFLTVNPALVEMLGYASEGEPLPADLSRDVYADAAAQERLVCQLRLGERFEGVEVEWKRRDGRPIVVRLSGRPVRNGHDAVASFEVIAEDVTERCNLEEQLRQAQKMEAIGRLAGGIAHDFNNLLMVIRGHCELLFEQWEPGEPLRRHAEQIQKGCDRAASLTRQLLAFSRKQVLAPSVLDLNAVVADMEKLLQPLIGEDIELAAAPGPGVGRVKADRGQIEQVILNLAVNARDAMPHGGRLALETSEVEIDEAYARRHAGVAPGRYAMLVVSDTGCGMDAETRSHIFEPFFTTKEQGKGTGLGLATVYGVVKQSGGFIWVYSEPGQGSTFKIYLPRAEETADAGAANKVVTGPPRGSETVLVVEDEDGVRELACEYLELSGYSVLEARDGSEALELALRHPGPIHLVVTDVVMPGMSGRELAGRLAQVSPGSKVLFVSGYTNDAVLNHGVLEQGMPFLQKPFTLDALARSVREVLDAPRAQASTPVTGK